MLRRPRSRSLVPLAVVVALALAGCGGDDGDGGAATSGEREQTRASTEASPAELEAKLKDTSTRPRIPKPTGSPPRRLEQEDIVKGKGPVAKPGDDVRVRYSGVTFSTGEEFDSSWDRGQPFSFRLGGGQVIEGWDRGIVGMRKGGRRQLTIPPEQAYGAKGFPPAIGPNETLVFVVDMLAIR
jgi:peptidylprolyl isomerase